MSASAVLRHVIDSITPASEAHRAEATRKLSGLGPMLQTLGGRLAAAQHGPPRARRRTLLIAAGDHGVADPGISLADGHPTVIAARAIDAGDAAIRRLARTARAEVLLLDCGCAESARMPASAVAVGRRPSGDLRQAAALTIVEAIAALEAGVAVTVSLLDPGGRERGEPGGTDLLALGALGLGTELSVAAITAALLGPEHVPAAAGGMGSGDREGNSGDDDRAVAKRAAALLTSPAPLDVLASFAGPEIATLTGVVLAAASMNLPVILDGEATLAAALLACRFAPHAAGYLIASQHGQACAPALLAALGLSPVFAGGVGHGEGAGAAMVLGLVNALDIDCLPPL